MNKKIPIKMKNVEYVFPLLADATSAAFGGAIIGNWIGDSSTAIISAIVGACLFAGYGVTAIQKKRRKGKTI